MINLKGGIKMKVKDCMCDNVYCVKPNTNIYEVVKLMDANHIGSVPICDDNNCICGIVTDRDILLRSITCEKNLKSTPISDIMTCNVCTCSENDEMSQAENTMSRNQIRRLPVCNEQNQVVGILTLGNLAQNDMILGKKEVCETLENICNCKGERKNNF